MANNTGNPVEPNGSQDPRDLIDNAKILDKLVNSSDMTWLGRLGKALKTWAGIMQQVTDYLIAQGYESVYLTYGAGVVAHRQTQLVQRDGELYRVMSASDIPLTLTGTWATDAPKLQAVGDAALRSTLSSATGTSVIGRGAGSLEDALVALETKVLPEEIVSKVVVDSVLDRTLSLTDSHAFNVCSHASANIRTIPPQADVAWKNNTEIEIFNDSLTPLLVAPGAGVSIVTPAGRVAKVATKGASKLKRISANRWLMNGDSEAALPASFVNSFGDSITYGVGATIPYEQHNYIYHLNTLRGWAIANRAVSASMTYDQAAELFRYTIEGNSTSTIMIGTNDRTRYGTANQYRMDCFKEAHMACLVWMGVADIYRVYPNNTAATYTGTWGSGSYGKVVSKFASAVGSTVSVPFSGKTVYVHYLKVDGYVGTVDVKVDGVTKATINVAGPGVTTNLGVTQGPGLIRIAGLIDGPHTLLLTLSTMTAGGAFVFHGISVPPETTTKPRANLMTIIKTTDPANDADIVIFNNMIKDNYNLLRFRDGLDVVLSDVWTVVDPATDMFNTLHPNDSGHYKIGRKAALDF